MATKTIEGKTTHAVTLVVNVPDRYNKMEAWLKERFSMSLADSMALIIDELLDDNLGIAGVIAEDIENRFALPKADFSMNINTMLGLLGLAKIQFDPENRIIEQRHYGTCPRCGNEAEFLDVMEGGRVTIKGCYACLTRDGYIGKLLIT